MHVPADLPSSKAAIQRDQGAAELFTVVGTSGAITIGRRDLDLRDHVVLAGAIGIAAGSTTPIADGAEDVAALSGCLAALYPDHVAVAAADILAAPRPCGLKLPRWRALYTREASLNLSVWTELFATAGEHALLVNLPARAAGLVMLERIRTALGA